MRSLSLSLSLSLWSTLLSKLSLCLLPLKVRIFCFGTASFCLLFLCTATNVLLLSHVQLRRACFFSALRRGWLSCRSELLQGKMAVDPRQVLAGFLTISMFAMLGNMIKRDHFDTIEVNLQEVSNVQFDVLKLEEKALAQVSKMTNGPPENSVQELTPCWAKPDLKEVDQTKGFITFSLTNGPEYHISEVTNAVVIARYLGAALVFPDIRGSELGQNRNFSDIYDADQFVQSLSGVIKVVKYLPADVAAGKPAVVRVPTRVTKDFIMENIEPVFRTNNYLRLASIFSSVNLKMKEKHRSDLDSTVCLAMFGSLEFKPEISEVADSIVERLKALSRDTGSRFIAVDLKTDVLNKKNCKTNKASGRKSCYNAQEIADFLRKIGYKGDETIYLTQTWWDERLNPLKEVFRKTYTKDDLIPADKKGSFLRSGNGELDRVLDFYICSRSDVFVPAISGLFYGNVAGKRIAYGKTEILVPSQVPGSSAAPSDFLSGYVSKKNHLAYSCFC